MNRRYIDLAGWLLSLVSLSFVLSILWSQRAGLAQWQADGATVLALLAAVVIYLAANFLLAVNWRRLVCLYTNKCPDAQALRAVYARSQIGKYIPGNVAHLAARHLLGRQLALSHAALMLAAALELAGLMAAAIAVGLVSFATTDTGQPGSELWLFTAAVTATMGFICAPRLIRAVSRWRAISLPLQDYPVAGTMVRVYLGYVLFFLLAGAAMLVLASQFTHGLSTNEALTIMTAFAAAFALGLVTPGAPSGLGVREAIIVVALDSLVPAAQAVLLALLFRLVTISGDVLFLAVASAEDRWLKRQVS